MQTYEIIRKNPKNEEKTPKFINFKFVNYIYTNDIERMMKKAILTLSLLFIIIVGANAKGTPVEIKSEIKAYIFVDENTCWTCIEGVKRLREIKLHNSTLKLSIFACSNNKQAAEIIKRGFNEDIEVIPDPLSLYPKEFKLANLPAIVIFDKKGEVALKEEWKNPAKYTELILKLDSISKEITPEIEGMKHIKTIAISDNQQAKANANSYNSGIFNKAREEIYTFNISKKCIEITSYTSQKKKEIPLPCESIYCNQPYLTKLINDSLISWVDYSNNGDNEYNVMNINTANLLVNKRIKEIRLSDSVFVMPKHHRMKSGEYIGQLMLRENKYLNANDKLLFLTESDFKLKKYIAANDEVFAKNRMSIFVNAGYSIAEDKDGKIFIASQASDKIFKYDRNLKLIDTIKLKYDKKYKQNLKDYSEKPTREERMEYRLSTSIINKIHVEKDGSIYIVYTNMNKDESGKIRSEVYIDKFNSTGERMIQKAILIPENYEVNAIVDNEIVITNAEKGEYVYYCYEVK